MTGASALAGLSERAQRYLHAVEVRLRGCAGARIAARIEELTSAHDRWRSENCLNMNPAESLISRRSRRLLDSDMATRLTEGVPGDKLYPHGRQNEIIDEIEATIIALARRQFGARFVEWRPVSTSMANGIVFSALPQPGDLLLAQDADGGGNYSYHRTGPAGLAGLRIENLPCKGAAFELDLDRISDLVTRLRPRMIAFGGSNVLFPYPVAELRAIADRTGSILLYDAAHLGLLISSGDFQRPLQEGAHVVTVSTHKIMGGPVGGLILSNDSAAIEQIVRVTFPGFMQTRDQNKYAALAVALAESAEFGTQLAEQMVANARALANSLQAQGFDVLAAERGFTQTHQLFLALGDEAQRFEARCHAANILVSDCALSGDLVRKRRSGARLATHEITRLGMREKQMEQIAALIHRVVRDTEEPQSVLAEVAELRREYRRVAYSFDPED